MATFTVSQLNAKQTDYTVQDADLIIATIGTSTADLSSVRMSFKQFTDLYTVGQYAINNGFSVQSGISALGGLSANHGGVHTVNIANLPTVSTGLQTGDIFTQTAAELGGTGSTKVICIL